MLQRKRGRKIAREEKLLFGVRAIGAENLFKVLKILLKKKGIGLC